MARPLYIDGSEGSLFAVYHEPPERLTPKAAILYAHPFAEELNKSRRMIALQAERMAAAGYAVLLPDLYGCGDSQGEFEAATWEVWQDDLKGCHKWLSETWSGAIWLWGLRLGGLLAAIVARELAVRRLILWQPVSWGEQMLTQFLRLRVAAGAFGGARESTEELLGSLLQGKTIEVGGYSLSPRLARSLIETPPLSELPVPSARVAWFETARQVERPIGRLGQKTIEGWRSEGSVVECCVVAGEPFWTTQEVTTSPSLLEKTTEYVLESSR